MGHVDVAGVRYELPDGRVLLDDVSFRVGDGQKVALVGANGAGKTTLLRIVTGDLTPHAGVVTRSGGLGVMRQFVGHGGGDETVADLLLSVAPPDVRRRLRGGRRRRARADGRRRRAAPRWRTPRRWGTTPTSAATTRGDLGRVHHRRDGAALRPRPSPALSTLSGGEQKRLVLEYLLRGPDQVLLLDEPDNYLDVPGKIWLEERIRESPKTILFISHDRELLNNTATRIVTVELGSAGNLVWTHPGGFASYHEARTERFERFEEMRRRWDEEHAKLQRSMLRYKQKSAYNSDMACRTRRPRPG